MASLEQPKKAPTGYWLFLGDHREEIVKTLGTAKGSAVSKKGGEMWKALGEAEKKPYEDKAKEMKAKYDEDLKAFKEDGGVVTRKARKGKEEKTKKDPNAPKKPAGGGYGCYLAEHRDEIVQSLPKGAFTAVTKAAGERWKALPEEEKEKYSAMFLKKQEEYKKAMEEYIPPEQPAESPSPAKKVTKKRAAEDSGEKEKKAPAAKKARGRPSTTTKGSGSKDAAEEINPEALAEAKKMGYEQQFKNLASRVEITALGLPADKMLSALKDANGLVNTAKRALLAGA